MHPQEEGRLELPHQRQGAIHRLARCALVLDQLRLHGPAWDVVVDLEALVQPVVGVQHDGRDHRTGRVAGGAEALGQGRHLRGNPEAAVVAHAVLEREEPGHHRRVGGQGHRAHRARLIEAHARPGQLVERVTPPRGRPVAPQGIRARRVERHQQQAGAGQGVRPRAGAARREGEHKQQLEASHPGTLAFSAGFSGRWAGIALLQGRGAGKPPEPVGRGARTHRAVARLEGGTADRRRPRPRTPRPRVDAEADASAADNSFDSAPRGAPRAWTISPPFREMIRSQSNHRSNVGRPDRSGAESPPIAVRGHGPRRPGASTPSPRTHGGFLPEPPHGRSSATLPR